MRVRSFATRPSALIGLSIVLAAHLWMQFDAHSSSEATSMGNLAMEDAMVVADTALTPDGDPTTTNMAAMAMCLVVLSGFALAFWLAKTRHSRIAWALLPPTEPSRERVTMRHPPWERRSLFAQSVSLLN